MAKIPTINRNFPSGGILNINITMQGWDQLVNATETVKTQFVYDVLDPNISNVNNFLWLKMKEKMHYWTGKRKAGKPHMRDVTREIKNGVAQYSVNVPVPYARRENMRPGSKLGSGPHNFISPAIQLTIQNLPYLLKPIQLWINNEFAKVQGGSTVSTPTISKITQPRRRS